MAQHNNEVVPLWHNRLSLIYQTLVGFLLVLLAQLIFSGNEFVHKELGIILIILAVIVGTFIFNAKLKHVEKILTT